MEIKKFRKKAVVIEAVQWDGTDKIFNQILRWSITEISIYRRQTATGTPLIIPTLEGHMECREGDWIIKYEGGKFYPCKPDIFEATYEPEEAGADDHRNISDLLLAVSMVLSDWDSPAIHSVYTTSPWIKAATDRRKKLIAAVKKIEEAGQE